VISVQQPDQTVAAACWWAPLVVGLPIALVAGLPPPVVGLPIVLVVTAGQSESHTGPLIPSTLCLFDSIECWQWTVF